MQSLLQLELPSLLDSLVRCLNKANLLPTVECVKLSLLFLAIIIEYRF